MVFWFFPQAVNRNQVLFDRVYMSISSWTSEGNVSCAVIHRANKKNKYFFHFLKLLSEVGWNAAG